MKDANKWDQAKQALDFLLNQWQGGPDNLQIDFGFDVFPGLNSYNNGDGCKVSQAALIDCAPNNEQNIMNKIATVIPNGATPLCNGMKRFLRSEYPNYAPKFTSDDATNYLLIISDGEDTCGGVRGECQGTGLFGATTPTSTQIGDMASRLANEGVHTFVIGFGDGVDPSQLNAIAASGDTPFKDYLIASDTASLQGAFEQIASAVVSCVFTLEPEDPTQVNPEEINFYFDTEHVPFDQSCAAGEAWRWVDETEKTTVEFCPGACDLLQSGKVQEVGATFGCPTIIPK
jgi:hypothetical protein